MNLGSLCECKKVAVGVRGGITTAVQQSIDGKLQPNMQAERVGRVRELAGLKDNTGR